MLQAPQPPREGEADRAGAFERRGGLDPSGIDLEAHHLHVAPHPCQPLMELKDGHEAATATDVDHDGWLVGASQAPALGSGHPAVAASQRRSRFGWVVPRVIVLTGRARVTA